MVSFKNLARLPAILFQEGRCCSAPQTDKFFCPMESTVKICKDHQKGGRQGDNDTAAEVILSRDSSIGSLEGQSRSEVFLCSFLLVLLLKRSTIQPNWLGFNILYPISIVLIIG